MPAHVSGRSGLSRVDRRLILGVVIITACADAVFSAYNFVVDPMADDLGATREQAVLLRQVPNLGTLLVVFLVGVLGSRLGMRRVIYSSAVVMTAGYVIVALAPALPMVTLGMLLGSTGKQGIGVVAISLVAARLISDDDRATGFAALGLAAPVGYLVFPILASLVLDAMGWRAVAGMWVLMGVAAALAARQMLPPDGEREAAGELWTPALAGLVLVGVVQVIRITSSGGLSVAALVWAGVTLVAALAVRQLMRRLPQPTLDLSLFKLGGARLLLIVVALVPFTNLFYFYAVGAQRLYGYSATQAALLMVPCQLAAIAGAWLARDWIRRMGLRRAGTLLLLGLSAALFLTTTQQLDTPVIVPVLVIVLFALAGSGAGVAVTNTIMNLAPPGTEGSASGVRTAAKQVGMAVGVALGAAAFFGIAQSTMQDLVTQSGGDWAAASQVLAELRSTTTTDQEIAEQYALPIEDVTEYNREWLEAQLAGYRAQGLLGGFVALAAAALFATHRRGLHKREPETAAVDGDPAGT